MTLPVSGRRPLPASLHDRYSPAQADALALIPQVIDLVAAVLGATYPLERARRASKRRSSSPCRAGSRRRPRRSLLRAIFISCVDHTPATPSSLAAITSYSGGNSLKTALAAGISAMGESHAGAGEGTARILMEFLGKMRQAQAAGGVFEADGVRIADLKDLAGYIVNKVTGAYGGEKGKIPGYGHRYYGLYGQDPRATTLLEHRPRAWAWPATTARWPARSRSMLKKKKAMALCFNVDGVIGAILCDLKLAAGDRQGVVHHSPHRRPAGPTAGAGARLVLPPLQRLGDLHRPGDTGVR